MFLENDVELSKWVYGLLHNEPTRPGDFLKSIAEAASRADFENYGLLRPVLLELQKKYPDYGCTCGWERS